MVWIVQIFAYLGAIGAIFKVGDYLDKWMDADPDRKRRFGQLLREKVESDPGTWLRAIAHAFLSLFDRVYRRRWPRLEQTLWLGLLLSLMMVALIHGISVAFAPSKWDLNNELALALRLTGLFLMVHLADLLTPRTRNRFLPRILVVALCSAFGGVLFGGAHGGALGGALLFALLGYLLVTLADALAAALGDAPGGALFVALLVALFSAFVFALGRFVSVAPKLTVNPVAALLSSFIAIGLVGLFQRDPGWAFIRAGQADPSMIALVAFNVFGGAFSLVETRWVLQRSANAGLLALLGWLALDLVLSASIFLLLPTLLWPQVLGFWDAARFRGPEPWLGILFWSTFSTSVLFYLFVVAALLARPLAALARGFQALSRPFNLEAHPVRCLSLAMALVVTVGFVAGGIAQALVGSSGVPPPP